MLIGHRHSRYGGDLFRGCHFKIDPVTGKDDGVPDPDPNAGGGGGGGGGGGKPAKTFTQEELNSMIAKEKRQWQEQQRQTLDQLEQLKKNKNLTEEEKSELQGRINELETLVLSKEEKAKKDLEAASKKFEEEKKQSQQREEHWKQQYTTSSIQRALLDAAGAEKAFNPSQIVDILQPRTSLEEDKDKVGRGLGTYSVKVRMKVKDAKTGETSEELLDPAAAVKLLKERPEYQNLFLSERPGGTGFRPAGAAGAAGSNLTPSQKIAEGLKANTR